MAAARRRHWTVLPPVEIAIYLALRAVLMVVHMFPYRAVFWLGPLFGRVYQAVDRKHSRIARQNVERAKDVARPDEIPEFLDRVYRHLGICILEILMIPRLIARGQIRDTFRLERYDVFDRCLEEGKGAIAIIGHLGNYELGGVVATMAGYPMNALARPVVNRHIDAFLTRYRSAGGNRIISTDNPIGAMIRVLRRNEILIIEIDQDAKRDGILVDYFGRPASTYRSAALFSIKYGAPIVIAECYREGRENVCVLSDPIRPDAYKDREDGIRALTQEVAKRFEECVRRHPDQWFWVYDRWRGAEKMLAKEGRGDVTG